MPLQGNGSTHRTEAIVHFSIGLSFGLFALVLLPTAVFSERDRIAAVFASGYWAMVPDVHWLFRELGFYGVSGALRGFHRSPLSNVFWFHHFLDAHEAARRHLEMSGALAVLFVALVVYYGLSRESDVT